MSPCGLPPWFWGLCGACSVWRLGNSLSPQGPPLPSPEAALGGACPGEGLGSGWGHCRCAAPSSLHTLPTAEQLGGYL